MTLQHVEAPTRATLYFNPQAEQQHAILSSALRSRIVSEQTTSELITVAVDLASNQLPSLVCWAETLEARDDDDLFIVLPATQAHHFRSVLPHGFNPDSSFTDLLVGVRACTPIPLDALFLEAFSEDAYQYAHRDPVVFEEALAGRTLRQLDNVEITDSHDSKIHRYRAVLTEPVMQGIVDFTLRPTQVIVTQRSTAQSAEPRTNGINSHAEEATTPHLEVEEDIQIDESFLAQSVLDDFSLDDIEEKEDLWEAEDDNIPVSNGNDTLKPSPVQRGAAPIVFSAKALRDRAAMREAIEVWADRAPQSGEQQVELPELVDEENAILVDERTLASLGAFNGDWVVAEAERQKLPRIARIFSRAGHASGATSSKGASSTPSAYVPPTFLQNLYLPRSYDPSSPTRLLVRLLHFASGQVPDAASSNTTCPIPLPFADSVHIARVASSISVDRAYQPLFLEALRTYFEGCRRVVRQGDVLAVGVEADKVAFVREVGEKDETGDEESMDFSLPSTPSAAPSAIVHFLITSLTPELLSPPEGVFSSDGAAHAHHTPASDLALRSKARTGELGCVVDPYVSKLIQTGVEMRRIADASDWLGVADAIPPCPALSDPPNTLSPLTSSTSNYAHLLSLVRATLLPQASLYGLHLSVLLKGARGSGKRTLAHWVAKSAGVHLVEIDCFTLISDTDVRTEGTLRARFEKAASCAPAILLLRNIDALARKSQALETGQEPALAAVLRSCVDSLRGGDADGQGESWPTAVFGTTSEHEKCPTGVLGCFKHELTIEAPNEAERLEMLQLSLLDARLGMDVSLKSVATQTAALVAADLVDLVARARIACIERVRKALSTGTNGPPSDVSILSAGLVLSASDFDAALSEARAGYSASIGAPKIPNVTWDDVGGLGSVKNDILDTIQLPLEHPELFRDGLKKRSGILLYGPPGTGKTLLAKAVATSCSLNFFSVKGPELLNMYIGESEANVRRVFARARDARPCVIFFDELDSVAPKRGNQGDSGGVMDRIVSQLLAELDGMSGDGDGGGGDVFVIGATNRPDLLDPALLRPGRFDRLLYLSVAETHAAQLPILEALTRKFKLDESLSPSLGGLHVIAQQCPLNLTGADFYALCSDAMLKAMNRKAEEVEVAVKRLNDEERQRRDAGGLTGVPGTVVVWPHPFPLTAQYYLAELAAPQEVEVRVGRSDFESALRELTPSVSEQEMAHYREVRRKFEDADEKTKEDVAVERNGSAETVEGAHREGGNELARRHVEDALKEMGFSIGQLESGDSGMGNGSSGLPRSAFSLTDGSTNVATSTESKQQAIEKAPGSLEPASSPAPSQTTNGKGKDRGKGKGKARAQ